MPDIKPGLPAAFACKESSVAVPSELSLAPAPGNVVRTTRPSWRRRSLAAASIAAGIFAIGAIAAFGLVYGLKLLPAKTNAQPGHVVAVLPFAADTPGQPDDPAFARTLTHGLIGYLSRFGGLRVISEQTSDLFGDHKTDVGRLKTDFGVQYAIIGHVQGSAATLKMDFQLVDTATQTNIRSGHLQRERADPTVVADEASRGIARMLAIEIDRLGVLRERANPISQLTIGELVARGYSELQMGTIGENLSAAMMLFDEALRRNPHYQPALLAVARVHIIAAMNFVDLDVASDLNETERVFKRGIGQIAGFDFSALQHGAFAEIPPQLRGEPARAEPLSRAQSKLPSGAGPGGKASSSEWGSRSRGWSKSSKPSAPQPPTIRPLATGIFSPPRQNSELGHERVALNWALPRRHVHAGVPSRQGVARIDLCHHWR